MTRKWRVAGMTGAGLLRAEAEALRDREPSSPDWATIERLLVGSYRDLHANLVRVSAD